MDEKKDYVCPLCNGKVSELATFYGCDNFKAKNCKYKIFKTIFDIPLTSQMLDDLLTKGETDDYLKGFFDKNAKKKFKARLRYNRNKNLLDFIDKQFYD